METIVSQMSKLIKDPELERLGIELNTPNFFNILRVERKEIRHSNFLSWLLDPLGSHGLSTLFIKWFLRDIFSDDKVSWMTEFDVDSLTLHDIRIYREWKHIDILIESKEYVIVVENKVGSKEHSNQLKRYREIIDKYYPEKKSAFVLLSPSNMAPYDEEDALHYITYSYEHLRNNIEILLDVNKDKISEKIRYYLNDYLTVLRRDIMKDHESIELAQKIYRNHKEALDFIFENKPDRMSELLEVIKTVVDKKGYSLCSCNKGYVRFLTHELNPIIPRTGNGWANKESFVFEIDFWPKKVTFRTVISPGDVEVREKLIGAIAAIDGTKKPRGNEWICHYSDLNKIDLTADNYLDDERVEKVIHNLIDKNEIMISKVQEAILKVL